MFFNVSTAGAADVMDIIQKIKAQRNYIILKLLTGNSLTEYLFFHFRIKQIPEYRIERIRKALAVHTRSQLDMIRYCELVRKMKAQTVVNFADGYELYFHYEIEDLIKESLE